jgi:Trk K+ transport system NAD-binding subunit
LKRLETRKRHPEEVPFEKGPWEIFILGMGRVGAGAYDWFQEHNGKETVGFDFNPETVERQQSQGRKVRQADVTDPDFWRRLQIPDGRCILIVLAMPEFKTMLRVTEMLKNIGYKGKTAAVAFHDDEVARLLEAGVDAAYNIYAEAGTGLAAHAVETLEPACR